VLVVSRCLWWGYLSTVALVLSISSTMSPSLMLNPALFNYSKVTKWNAAGRLNVNVLMWLRLTVGVTSWLQWYGLRHRSASLLWQIGSRRSVWWRSSFTSSSTSSLTSPCTSWQWSSWLVVQQGRHSRQQASISAASSLAAASLKYELTVASLTRTHRPSSSVVQQQQARLIFWSGWRNFTYRQIDIDSLTWVPGHYLINIE